MYDPLLVKSTDFLKNSTPPAIELKATAFAPVTVWADDL
jgi:hypothetical protein